MVFLSVYAASLSRPQAVALRGVLWLAHEIYRLWRALEIMLGFLAARRPACAASTHARAPINSSLFVHVLRRAAVMSGPK